MTAAICGLGYAAAMGLAIAVYVRSGHGSGIVADAVRRDRLAELAAMIYRRLRAPRDGAHPTRERWRDDHIGEYYALLAAAGGGMLVLRFGQQPADTTSSDWSGSRSRIYILCAIDRDRLGGLEAALEVPRGRRLRLGGSALRLRARVRRRRRARFRGHRRGRRRDHDTLLVVGLAMMVAGLAFKASRRRSTCGRPTSTKGRRRP